MSKIAFMDFEASSLNMPFSYPIEVGFATTDRQESSYLIRPEWNWTDWDSESEAIHHIKRDELLRSGLPAEIVAQHLNDLLHGYEVFCDSPNYDRIWFARLYQAANIEPSFQLYGMNTLYARYLMPPMDRLSAAVAAGLKHPSTIQAAIDTFEALEHVAQQKAFNDSPPNHRALPDARYLLAIWQNFADASKHLIDPIG